MYKVVKNTSVGYDKVYELSKCTQAELKKLYTEIPNLREKFIIYEQPITRSKKRTSSKS